MKTIVVTGLGRCGSSLMMNILYKAGFECNGSFPDYEVSNKIVRGKANKVLFNGKVPRYYDDNYIISLHRDPKQQALSQIKLMGVSFLGVKTDYLTVFRMQQGIESDQQTLDDALSKKDKVITLNFEDLICNLPQVLNALSKFLSHDFSNDLTKLVLPRSPECFEGFLELELITKGNL